MASSLFLAAALSAVATAGGEYVEKVAQLRLRNDTTAGYVFAAHSPAWCEGACEKNLDNLTVVEVNMVERRVPFAPHTAALLAVQIPPGLKPDQPDEHAAFWRDIRELSTLLRDCGAEAVMIYHGTRSCREQGRVFCSAWNEPECGTVQVLGHCFVSIEDTRHHPVFSECRAHAERERTYPMTVQLDGGTIPREGGATAIVRALQHVVPAASPAPHANATNTDCVADGACVQVDLHVTLSACGNYGQFPAMYWSLVPLWTGLAFVWIALSCQMHSSFATTIHSVMTVIPVLKVMDVAISAWLWTDCVASGTFSTSAVLAWVAIRSLYEPFFMLIFLLIANGWCILRRDMPRTTSLTISVVITSLYLVLALNFLYAGNFWWVVGTITIGTIVYSVIRVRGFVLYLTERIESMDPEAFQEMHSQAVFKKGMFIRLQRIVQFYLVVQIVDYAFVQVEWQGEQAWKSQVFEQTVEIIVVTAMGFVFRPKQPGSGAGGRARYFLEAGADQGGGSMRQVPFYEMSPVSTPGRGAAGGAAGRGPSGSSGGGGGSPGAVVVVNPNSTATNATQRYSVGQHVSSPPRASSGLGAPSPAPAMVGMPSISFGHLGGATTAI